MTHKIFKTIKIGNYSAEKILKEYEASGIKISSYAKEMLSKIEWQKETGEIDLVKLSVADMGFVNGATTNEIYSKAKELGLELCPQETCPILRLDKDLSECLFCGMKQIDVDGSPRVFDLGRYSGGLWLHGSWAEPDSRWSSNNEFVFRLRKSFDPLDTLLTSDEFKKSDKEKIKVVISYLNLTINKMFGATDADSVVANSIKILEDIIT